MLDLRGMRDVPSKHGNIELRHLRYFVAVAETGSLTDAARTRLHIAQPALGRQIRELELAVGASLFDRRPRGVTLTPTGARFLAHVRAILARVDEAFTDIRGQEQVLRVGCLAGVEHDILPELTTLVQRHAPRVDMQIVGASSARLVEMLRAGEVDLALMREDPDALDLEFKPVASQAIVALLPGDHRLARKRKLGLDDLLALPQVTVSRSAAPLIRDTVDRWFIARGAHHVLRHTAADLASAMSLILTTHGYALVPDYARRIAPGSVVAKPLVDGPSDVTLSVAWRPKNPSPVRQLVRAIVDDWPFSPARADAATGR